MIPSDRAILTFFLSILFVIIYINIVFRKSPILTTARWRMHLPIVIIINIVCYAAVALYFNSTYGYITDDTTYFMGALTYTKGFNKIKNGTEFMFYISRPLRIFLDLDRVSFHILWGALGLIGSFNFLYVLTKRIDFREYQNYRDLMFKFIVILCFPNFMVWGRFYGKDTTTFLLCSIYCVSSYYLLAGVKIKLRHILLCAAAMLFLYYIRPHIAMMMTVGLLLGVYFRSSTHKRIRSNNERILYEILFPLAVTILLFVGTIFYLQKLTNKPNEMVTVTDIEQSLVGATQMGAFGGSATSIADDMKENSRIIFSPKQIVINMFVLFLAPMPWEIRGFPDFLAFVSNILLFIVFARYAKQVNLSDVYQKHLAIICILLIGTLSFMTGNVGLILRQKTIILPFVLLFLFKGNSIKRKISEKHRRRAVDTTQPVLIQLSSRNYFDDEGY